MNTNKAAYWIALAAFAIGMSSDYQKGSFQPLHRVANHAQFALCRVTAHAERVLAAAGVLTERPALPTALPTDDMSAAVSEWAMAQADLGEQARERAELYRDQIRVQAEMMRVQAQLQRDQIEQIRVRTASQFRFSSAANRRVVVTSHDCSTPVAIEASADGDDN